MTAAETKCDHKAHYFTTDGGKTYGICYPDHALIAVKDARIRALEEERDWLKADMVVMTTELTTAEKDRVMLLAVIDRVKALADEYANDPAKYYREMGHTAEYYWQEGCFEAARRIRAALARSEGGSK